MGSAFNSDIFNLSANEGTGSNLPADVVTCSYTGPRFTSGGLNLVSTVTVACTNTCGSL
jgi:hypothetical protein